MFKRFQKPPLIAELLLRLFARSERERFILGDFEEMYKQMLESEGKSSAWKWYWSQTLLSVPNLIKNRIIWSLTMLRNYLKLAVRNMLRNKIHSFIKVFGFSLGLASCILIFIYVKDEMSFDNYHRDLDRIYRVSLNAKSPKSSSQMALTPGPLAEVLKEKYPQVEEAGRILQWDEEQITYKNKTFYEAGGFAADPGIFNILSVHLLSGEVENSFKLQNTVIITKSMARKYFGNENPVGKIIKIGSNPDANNFQICAVADDSPDNTFFKYNYIISARTLENQNLISSSWFGLSVYTFVKLKPRTDVGLFENQIRNLSHVMSSKSASVATTELSYFLQPVGSIHLNNNLVAEINPSGNPMVLMVLSAIAFLLLVLAAVNYLNITTSLSFKRIKEVSLRKVVGGNVRQLLIQFISESLIIAVISLAIAVIIVAASIPAFNALSGKNYHTSYLFSSGLLVPIIIGALFIGLLSSLYPAVIVSKYNPVKGIKAALDYSSNNLLRKLLLTIQYSISLIFVFGSAFIVSQVNYMTNANLGFEKEQKMILQFRDKSLAVDYESIKSDFGIIPGIVNSSVSSGVPSQQLSSIVIGHENATPEEFFGTNILAIDPDFIPNFKLKLLSGRNFDKNIMSDIDYSVIINKTAYKMLGFANVEDAIGKIVKTSDKRERVKIVGVIDDFHYRGLQTKISPLMMSFSPGKYNVLALTFNPSKTGELISNIREKWDRRFSGKPFEFNFLDESFASLYSSEKRLGNLIMVFAGLSVLISSIGLAGMISITMQQRKREIGIRRVLGSSEVGIIRLIASSYLKWIIAGNIIAVPVAYYLINNWLSDFAYKIDLSLIPFILISFIVLGSVLMIIASQAYKTAISNIIESVRND